MESVIDINHFNTLVNESHSKGKIIVSNCYLLSNDIYKYTLQNRMFFKKNKGGLFLICEERDFFYLYYYIPETQIQDLDIRFEDLTKPIIVDLVYLELKKNQSLIEIEKSWLKQGFYVHKIYKRMSLDTPLGGCAIQNKFLFENHNYTLSFAQPTHVQEIQYLWRDNLDILSTAMPTDSELLDLITNKQLPCIFDKDNKVVATLQFLCSGKVRTIKHVVVNAAHRQSGLAKVLLHSLLKENKDINKYILWVDKENLPAIMLYKKCGFYFDGKITSQLVMKKLLYH